MLRNSDFLLVVIAPSRGSLYYNDGIRRPDTIPRGGVLEANSIVAVFEPAPKPPNP